MGFGFKQPLVGGKALRDDPNNGCEGDYWWVATKISARSQISVTSGLIVCKLVPNVLQCHKVYSQEHKS